MLLVLALRKKYFSIFKNNSFSIFILASLDMDFNHKNTNIGGSVNLTSSEKLMEFAEWGHPVQLEDH